MSPTQLRSEHVTDSCNAAEACEDPDWDMLACGGKKRAGQGASPAARRRRTSDVSFLSVSAASDEDEDEEGSADAEGEHDFFCWCLNACLHAVTLQSVSPHCRSLRSGLCQAHDAKSTGLQHA